MECSTGARSHSCRRNVRRTVTIEEVGETGAYMVSDMSRGVTGEIHHVDAGYHVVGMKNPEAPDLSLERE